MILPADVVKELQQIPVMSVVVAECVNGDDSTDEAVEVSSDHVQSVSEDTFSLVSGEVTNAEFCNNSAQDDETVNDDARKLLDASLADCWSMARQGKGNFVLSQGLLYRKDKVEGQPVCQLCVPTTRREPILKLAHDSVYGSHLGERKTVQRK